MSLAPDPADRQLDALADGAFGGKHSTTDNRRAGYGGVEFDGVFYTKMEWLLRAARRGACLAWGESAKVCAYYEQQIADLREQLASAYTKTFHVEERLAVRDQERDQFTSMLYDCEQERAALREQLAAVTRERDALRDNYAMSLEENGEVMRQREKTSSQLWNCMNERDGWKHRAERMARVVDQLKALRVSPLCRDGENNDEVAAYEDGYSDALSDVRDTIRALDAQGDA